MLTPQMNKLIEISQKLLGKESLPELEWQSLKIAFKKEIENCVDVTVLINALAMNKGNRFPVDLKNELYERIINLNGATYKLLIEYSDHLWLHGPDWDDYAKELKERADKMVK